MVGLYKDPKGEKIFEKSTLSTATPNFQSQTMEDLKKRVTELEAIVANKKVCVGVCLCIHVFMHACVYDHKCVCMCTRVYWQMP